MQVNFTKWEKKIIEGFKNKIFPIYYDEREKFREEDEEEQKQEDKTKKNKKKNQKNKIKINLIQMKLLSEWLTWEKDT